MAETVRGVVARTFERAFGNKTMHSFTIKGVEGFFGTGARKAVEEGKSYEFEYSKNAKGFIDVNLSTLRPWESGVALQGESVRDTVNTSRYSSGGGKASFRGGKSEEEKGFWANREAREVKNDRLRELGATRNTALQLVTIMLANGAVKLPTKEAAREEAIDQLFEHYTDTLLKGKSTDETPPAEEGKVSEDVGEPEWK